SLFVHENVQTQRQLSENTTAFLENHLADAQAKMEEQEAKVASFKAKHVGDLPGQLESNVQILAGLQAQLENTQHALDASKQQKIYLESLLQQYQSAQANLASGDSTLTATQVVDKELLGLRLQLDDLDARYTDRHPDMIALKGKIAKTQILEIETQGGTASNQESSKTTNAVDPGAMEGLQHGSPTAMMQIQSQLKANQLQIQN